MSAVTMIALQILWEDVNPLQNEFKHLGGKLKYLLHICLRWVIHQSDQGVEVDKKFSSYKLCTLECWFKASEFTLCYFLNVVKHGHLVSIIEAELSESSLGLASVSLGILSERGYPWGANPHDLKK